jgi:hypothetical protein
MPGFTFNKQTGSPTAIHYMNYNYISDNFKRNEIIFFNFSYSNFINGPPYRALSQGTSKKAAMNQNQGSLTVLRHIVLFKFKDAATPAQVKEVQKAFSALPGKIHTIVSYEWGTNISPENLNQGFTHCFLVTFKNTADRDSYLVHPAHKEFGQILKPYLDKVLVIDFMGEK